MKTLITKTTLTLVALLLGTRVFGQMYFKSVAEYQAYKKNRAYIGYEFVDTTKATPRQLEILHRQQKVKSLQTDHYYYEYPLSGNLGVRFVKTDNTKSEIYEGERSRNNIYKTMLINGNCGVEFSALDVTKKNAAAFRYHVVQNDDRELVTWTIPTQFKRTTDGKYEYAYLGKFNYVPGQVLKIELYNIYDYKHMDGFTIDWRKVEQADVEGYIQYYSAGFHQADNGLFSKGLTDLQQKTELYYPSKKGKMLIGKSGTLGRERPRYPEDFIETTNKNDIRFRADDSVRNLHFNIKNGYKNYNYKISLKRETAEFTDSINLAEINESYYDVNREFWKTPGKYKITFTPKIHRHGGSPVYLLRNLATSVSFTVLPPLDQTRVVSEKAVGLIVLSLILVGGLIFLLYRARQKNILMKEEQEKQIAALKLQSVRAQLNPHFIFNALAGIQNLVNKNATEDANRYLTRFARLTRNVLDDGDKEFISIEQELSLLDDYLKMEQTRFNFKFRIDIDDVDQHTDIPAMLLQPFVENAVKHAISSLKEAGLITINIMKQKNNLVLVVQDNGKGFNPQKAIGVGIKLCRDRIALLNSIYKNTYISMQIYSDNKGTLVAIELKNWL